MQKCNFTFAKKRPDVCVNYNEHITDVLEQLKRNYEILKDMGRFHAYREAISRIKGHPSRITSVEELRGHYKIGPKILKKVFHT